MVGLGQSLEGLIMTWRSSPMLQSVISVRGSDMGRVLRVTRIETRNYDSA